MTRLQTGALLLVSALLTACVTQAPPAGGSDEATPAPYDDEVAEPQIEIVVGEVETPEGTALEVDVPPSAAPASN